MRTIIIITVFFALILSLAACSKTKVPSDATIQQMLVGTWGGDDIHVTFRPDLSFHDNNAQGMIGGQWRVDSGFLVMTIRKWDTRTNLNDVVRYKITSIDDQKLVHGMSERKGFPARDNVHIEWIRMMPNTALEPTPIGHRSSAVAVSATNTARLSFFR